MGQIFLTASLNRDHSILYALVCEKKLYHMSKTAEIPVWCSRRSKPCYLTQETREADRLVVLQQCVLLMSDIFAMSIHELLGTLFNRKCGS